MLFSWFKPRCPVGTRDKVWIESRMRWLTEQLGAETLLNAEVIVPTTEFFPEHWNATQEEAYPLFDQIGDWMGVPRGSVGLEFVEDIQLPGALGHYDATPEALVEHERPIVRIAKTVLEMPAQLAATMAHELAHERLLGGGLLTADVADHEFVTDLLPVFLGLGIVQANATIHEYTVREGRVSLYTAKRSGYLSSLQLGYALALFAWVRKETSPAWAHQLRLDALSTFRAGLRFLTKTGESLFDLDTLGKDFKPRSEREWLEGLRSPRADIRLATLHELAEPAEATPAVIDGVCHLFSDGDQDIPGDAARALGRLGSAGTAATPQLIPLLHSRNEDTVLGAIEALSHELPAPTEFVPHLANLLQDDRYPIARAAVALLTAYGPAAESAEQQLVAALLKAVHRCDNEDVLATALCCVSTRAMDAFTELAPEDLDEETYRAVLVLLNETQADLDAQTLSASAPAGDEDERV